MSRARIQFLLRGLFSAGLVAVLLSRVQWGQLAGLIRGAHAAPFAAGASLTLVGLLLMAARTCLLLRHWGIVLKYRAVVALTWLGQFCNAFLPGSTGGDVVKFYRVCRLVPGAKSAGFAALVADRLVALVALVLLAGGALVFGDHRLFTQFADSVQLEGTGRLWMAGGVLALCAVISWVVARSLWRSVRFEATRAKLRRALREMGAGLRGGSALWLALLISVAVHLANLSVYYLFARALQIPATFGQLMVVWPVVMVVTLLPLTVNGYGLRECVTLFYFQHWHLVSGLHPGTGVRETVIALSLLSVVNDFFWSVPGGFCLSAGRSETPATAAEAGDSSTAEAAYSVQQTSRENQRGMFSLL